MPTETKSILLTGGTGFLGKIIHAELSAHGLSVTTLGRSSGNEIQCDLAVSIPAIDKAISFVVHNAGKAHVVPRTEEERKEFYAINVEGTKNLLAGLDQFHILPKAFVFISTIAVYGLSAGLNINEDHVLDANDPYGRSKIEAEEIITNWCRDRNVSLAILRLPLLAGENAPGNLGAMVAGMRNSLYVSIAGGKARKSMVMAKDVARIIPVAFNHAGIYHLTDGHHPSFRELEVVIAKQLKVSLPHNIPLWLARVLGIGGDFVEFVLPGKAPVTTRKVGKIISTLTFDDGKARRELGWRPGKVVEEFQIAARC